MPELPETETIARDLNRLVRGAVIESVAVPRMDVLRGISARTLASRLPESTIDRCWRRAKLVVVDLSTGDRLVVQPRFTGALLVGDRADATGDADYTAVELRLRDGRSLRYRDVRRLGTVSLMNPARFAAYSGALGIEPLDLAFTPSHLDRKSVV